MRGKWSGNVQLIIPSYCRKDPIRGRHDLRPAFGKGRVPGYNAVHELRVEMQAQQQEHLGRDQVVMIGNDGLHC